MSGAVFAVASPEELVWRAYGANQTQIHCTKENYIPTLLLIESFSKLFKLHPPKRNFQNKTVHIPSDKLPFQENMQAFILVHENLQEFEKTMHDWELTDPSKLRNDQQTLFDIYKMAKKVLKNVSSFVEKEKTMMTLNFVYHRFRAIYTHFENQSAQESHLFQPTMTAAANAKRDLDFIQEKLNETIKEYNEAKDALEKIGISSEEKN